MALLGSPLVTGRSPAGLLNNFLTSPATIMGLSVLYNADRPAAGLLAGIRNSLATQRAELLNQIYREQLAQQVLKSRQQAQYRQLFSQALGTPPTPFVADTFPGESQSNLSGQITTGLQNFGTGMLADNKVDPEELRNLALRQLSLGNVAGTNAVIGFMNATIPKTKTELALAAADGDEKALEALRIMTGTEVVKPLSYLGKINSDLEHGLITKEQANRAIQSVGRSPGFKEQYMAPILEKIQKGIPLTPGEEQIKDFFKTVNPFDEMFKAAMQGNKNNSESTLLQDAREAISQGADRSAVEAALRAKGVDPGKL